MDGGTNGGDNTTNEVSILTRLVKGIPREIQGLTRQAAQHAQAQELYRKKGELAQHQIAQNHLNLQRELDAHARQTDEHLKQPGRSAEHQEFIETQAQVDLAETAERLRAVTKITDYNLAQQAAAPLNEPEILRQEIRDVTPRELPGWVPWVVGLVGFVIVMIAVPAVFSFVIQAVIVVGLLGIALFVFAGMSG